MLRWIWNIGMALVAVVLVALIVEVNVASHDRAKQWTEIGQLKGALETANNRIGSLENDLKQAKDVAVTKEDLEQTVGGLRSELYWPHLRDRQVTYDSFRYAEGEFERVMAYYEKSKKEVGHQSYWGNLGDYAFPLLEHLVDASKAKVGSNWPAERGLIRMRSYIDPEDSISVRVLKGLEERLATAKQQ